MAESQVFCKDSVAIAGELGRLDFVSAILAVLGIVLVLAGIFAFIEIRNKAKKQAKLIAQEVSKEVAERVANVYIQENFPNIMEAYLPLFKQLATLDDTSANDIASAQDTDNE